MILLKDNEFIYRSKNNVFLRSSIYLIVIGALIFLAGIFEVSAVAYVPLAPLPGVPTGDALTLGSYLSALFKIVLGLAGVFAVLMIVVAGTQYIGGAGNPAIIQAARSRITNALWGLGIAMFSVIILLTINPALLSDSISLTAVPEPSAPDYLIPPPGTDASPTGPPSQPDSDVVRPPFQFPDVTFELPPVVFKDPNNDFQVVFDCMQRVAAPPCEGADINKDGIVSYKDLSLFRNAVLYDLNNDGILNVGGVDEIETCFLKRPLSSLEGFEKNFGAMPRKVECAMYKYPDVIVGMNTIESLKLLFFKRGYDPSIAPAVTIEEKRRFSVEGAYLTLKFCNTHSHRAPRPPASVCGFVAAAVGKAGQSHVNKLDLLQAILDINKGITRELTPIQTFVPISVPRAGIVERYMYCSDTFLACFRAPSPIIFGEMRNHNLVGLICRDPKARRNRHFICFLSTNLAVNQAIGQRGDFLSEAADLQRLSPVQKAWMADNHVAHTLAFTESKFFYCDTYVAICFPMGESSLYNTFLVTLIQFDVNNDGIVDLNMEGADMALVTSCIGKSPEGSCARADLNIDGKITDNDFELRNLFIEHMFTSDDITYFFDDFTIEDLEAKLFSSEGWTDGEVLAFCFGKRLVEDCIIADINGDFVVDQADVDDFLKNTALFDVTGDGIVVFTAERRITEFEVIPEVDLGQIIGRCIGEEITGECSVADIDGDGFITVADLVAHHENISPASAGLTEEESLLTLIRSCLRLPLTGGCIEVGFDAEGEPIINCTERPAKDECIPADIDGDGLITTLDSIEYSKRFAGGSGESSSAELDDTSQLIISCVGKPVEGDCAPADINGDGVITFDDLNLFTEESITQ